MMLWIYLAALIVLVKTQDVQIIDTSNVVDVNLSFEDPVKMSLTKADGTISNVVINKFDHIHSILSQICPRVDILDCDGVMDQISLWYFGVLYTPSLPHARNEDYTGTRKDIMRHIADNFVVNDYLEIGTGKNDAFKEASQWFRTAVGVDPKQGGTLRMTSDEFFANNTSEFDLIFVDGLHEANQAFRDIHNALKILRPGKVRVV